MAPRLGKCTVSSLWTLPVQQCSKQQPYRYFASLPKDSHFTSTTNTRTATFSPPRPKKIVVGITGATGAPYAIRVLSILRELGVQTHLVMSKWAMATMKYETTMTELDIRRLAHASYTARDMSSPIASGSFQHDGMIIVPCSMKTLSAVRTGFCDDLVSRAADVSIKEGRKLVLVVRETPLSEIHLENMLGVRRAGAVIFPPVPAFYTRPASLEEMVEQSVGRMLDSLGINVETFPRWNGFEKSPAARSYQTGELRDGLGDTAALLSNRTDGLRLEEASGVV